MKGHPELFLLRLTLAIWLFLFIAPASRAQGDYVRASVRSVKGIARIYAGTQPGVFTPKRNDPLEPGNTIETGWNGRVVISLSDGGQITVLPNSRVVLKTFIVPHSARELLEILMGRVLVKIRHVGGKPNPYRLNSPTASIAVRGTEFIVDVLSGGETVVVVREGLVEVWSRNNPLTKLSLSIRAGCLTSASGGSLNQISSQSICIQLIIAIEIRATRSGSDTHSTLVSPARSKAILPLSDSYLSAISPHQALTINTIA